MLKKEVYKQIQKSIEAYNKSVGPGESLLIHPETRLMGESLLGSLGLATLLNVIEQNICDHFKVQIDLIDELAFNQKVNPFRNIQTLTEYIAHLLKLDYDV